MNAGRRMSASEIRERYLDLWELNDIVNAVVAVDERGRLIVALDRLPEDRRDAILRRWSSAFAFIDRDKGVAAIAGASETGQAEALLRCAPDLTAPNELRLSAKVDRLVQTIVGAAEGDDGDGEIVGREIEQVLSDAPDRRRRTEEALRAVAGAASDGDIVAVVAHCATLIEVLEEVGDRMSPPGFIFFFGDGYRPAGWTPDGAVILRELTLARHCAVQDRGRGEADAFVFSSKKSL